MPNTLRVLLCRMAGVNSHGCIANMLTRVNAVGHAKPLVCPTCRVTTNVPHGKAANLPKNFSLLAAMQ